MIENASIWDITNAMSREDTILILPTLDHALYYWPLCYESIRDRHGEPYVVRMKTAIVSRRTHTALRLWVPYAPEPTQPMDTKRWRAGYEIITPYSRSAVRGWAR